MEYFLLDSGDRWRRRSVQMINAANSSLNEGHCVEGHGGRQLELSSQDNSCQQRNQILADIKQSRYTANQIRITMGKVKQSKK